MPLKQAISGRLTFTTPAVMSDVSRRIILFISQHLNMKKINNGKGAIKKYKLNSRWDIWMLNNGMLPDKLNMLKAASSRNIWTSGYFCLQVLIILLHLIEIL